MIAPSEKHLEDWIVANLRWFSSCIVDDGYTYDHYGAVELSPGRWVQPCGDRLIARQFPLPHGIADLILRTDDSIFVAELKKGAIDAKSVVQCARYIHDVREVFSWVYMERSRDYKYPATREWEVHSFNDHEVKGILVGNSLADEYIPLLCDLCNIWIYLYDFDGVNYTFDWVTTYDLPTTTIHASQLAKGALGDALLEIMIDRSRKVVHEQ